MLRKPLTFFYFIPCQPRVSEGQGNKGFLTVFQETLYIKEYFFFYLYVCLVDQSCPTVCDPVYCSLRGSSVRGDSPNKNTGVGCHAFLQGIFPTQGLNPGLLHCWQILYHLSHKIVFNSSQYRESIAYFVPGTFTYDDMISMSQQPYQMGNIIILLLLEKKESKPS